MKKSLISLTAFVFILGVTGISLTATIQPLSNNVFPPADEDSIYTIKVNNVTMNINAAIGARIISCKLDGNEILSGKEVHPMYYGSSLWLSPQDKWKEPGLLDAQAYTINDFSETALRVTSRDEKSRGFIFSKQFTASPEDTSISIRYTITNISKDNQALSPWEVTRVPTGGLAFYPEGEKAALSKSNLPYADSIGMVWYPYDSSTLRYQKLFLFGSEGWLAYVLKGILFIKKFPVVKADEVAPGEENVEIYVNPQKTYMELENQGVYTQLKSNESVDYEVKWYVRYLPSNVNAGIGNQALVNYVRSVLKLNRQGTKP